jgi:hypothetical protein
LRTELQQAISDTLNFLIVDREEKT